MRVVLLLATAIGLLSCTGTSQVVVTRRAVAPDYPPLAITAGVQSDVVVIATIDEFGNVRDATVPQGPPLLGAAAQRAAQQWLFNAGRGTRRAELTFSFRIAKEAASLDAGVTAYIPPFRVEVSGRLPQPTINYGEPYPR